MNARVQLPSMPDQHWQAQVMEVGAYPRGKDRRYPVELQWNEAQTSLRPGLTAMVEVLSYRVDDALMVPHAFLIRDGDAVFVQTRSERLPVDVAASTSKGVLVRSGLKAGTELILP